MDIKVADLLCSEQQIDGLQEFNLQTDEDVDLIKGKALKSVRKVHDRLLLESTERCLIEPNFDKDGNIEPVFKTRLNFANANYFPYLDEKRDGKIGELLKPQSCYVCKNKYSAVHHFYHRLCLTCANTNYNRRSQTADLTGRVALVTGGRIKIGFEIALKLLRAGARVIVSSRFKHDAVVRFQKQDDYENWQSRLLVYGLDLKHIPSVDAFADYICTHYETLDILINNAAQTLRKPVSYYQAMAVRDNKALEYCDKKVLGHFDDLNLI